MQSPNYECLSFLPEFVLVTEMPVMAKRGWQRYAIMEALSEVVVEESPTKVGEIQPAKGARSSWGEEGVLNRK